MKLTLLTWDRYWKSEVAISSFGVAIVLVITGKLVLDLPSKLTM